MMGFWHADLHIAAAQPRPCYTDFFHEQLPAAPWAMMTCGWEATHSVDWTKKESKKLVILTKFFNLAFFTRFLWLALFRGASKCGQIGTGTTFHRVTKKSFFSSSIGVWEREREREESKFPPPSPLFPTWLKTEEKEWGAEW